MFESKKRVLAGAKMNDIKVTKDRPIDTRTDPPSRRTTNDQECVTNPSHPPEEIAGILSVLFTYH